MPTETFYVLELHAEGCQAEFWLNDLAVIRRGEGVGQDYNGQCNHQLVPGRNELTVVIQPGSHPSVALTGEPARQRDVLGRAVVQATLSSYPYGAVVGDHDIRTTLIDLE